MADSYDLVVGAKRQVTIPAELLKRLSLKEGDHLRVIVEGEQISLEPMVSVPRRMVSAELLAEMNARRGAKADDVSLSEFMAQRFTKSQQQESQGGLGVETRTGNEARPREDSPAPSKLILYTAPWCRDAMEAKRFLAKHKIPFQEIDVETTPGARDEVIAHVGGQAYPQLVIDGEWMQPYEPGLGFMQEKLAKLLGVE